MGKRKETIVDQLARREAAAVDANTIHNRNMRRAMVISRANGGPYTYDELFDDYSYQGGCLCTPVRFFLFLLFLAVVIVGILWLCGVLSLFGYSFNAGKGRSSGSAAPTQAPFVDVLPEALTVTDLRTDTCDDTTCQV